jgi:2-oxoglutarate ferredoxin oxidoreductase subunit alpha
LQESIVVKAAENKTRVMTNGSQIMAEAFVRTGADVFVGYPITPANWLFSYASENFSVSLAAPDEITTLQWMAGFSAAGKIPVTATSFPGFALMVESLNMAYMMELPLVITLAQRLGPSTGSATTGAQGDLLLLRGSISGGYCIPVFSPSDFEDCWTLTSECVRAAAMLRTPVVLLTSKEMIMTNRSFDLSRLPSIEPVERRFYDGTGPYRSYEAGEDQVAPFLPVGNDRHQVRLNASTHGKDGLIQKATKEAMDNTRRLQEKIEGRMPEFTRYDLDEPDGSDTLIVAYGITAEAARDAVVRSRRNGKAVSLLVIKTLLPISPVLLNIIDRYERVLFAEENLSGLLREVIYGRKVPEKIRGVNRIGKMITPSDILKELERK